jgi:dipeptidyl aminopeptidase/acylaminoacyl peptidase
MSEDARTLTAELVVDKAVPRYPVISPDGTRVAYVVTTTGPIGHPISALWVAAADRSSPPGELTAMTEPDCAPRWAPDSSSLFFGSGHQLHQIRLDGGPAEVLTAWRGGISDQWPLADGQRVAVLAEDEPTEEDERRRAERDDAVVWGERVPFSRLRLLDPGTRELRVVAGLGDRHIVEVVQRPDGGPLAAISWACPETEPGVFTAELHVVDPGSGAVRDLGRVELEAQSPAWWSAGDGWHLAYLARTPPRAVGGLAVFDVTASEAGTGAGEQHRNLTTGMTVCPDELVQVASGGPLAMFADGLDTAICRLDPDAGRFRRVSTREGGAAALSASHSGEMVAALASTAYEPQNVHAGPAGGPLIRISDTRPDLRRIRWGAQERLSYQAGDGLNLDGLLILPAARSQEDGPFPLVTLVHGGPDDRYADEMNVSCIDPGQWLATAGYAVFLPNPRGSTGRGHEFAAAVAGAVGLDEWSDIVSGIDLLIADGVADPDRLGIGGWSHGGFMAAWAVGQTDRFKAAFMGAGISDWGMQVAAGELGTLEADLGGSCGWEGPGPHSHDRLSPISFASRVRTPVLILHGADDTNVPLGQATYFHRALCRFGVEHEFVVYPREGHGIVERHHQLDVLRRTRAWFDRWLGGPASDQDRRPQWLG